MTETIRPFLFFGTLILLLVWETVHPFVDHFRRSAADRGRHLLRNFAVAAFNALMVSTIFVALWAIAAFYSETHRIGLLHHVNLPQFARVALALLLLDAWTYAWHWMNHRIPLLWRFHRMHHSDAQMDVTTANRFHFGEIAGSSLLRIPLILLLGVRLPELVLYEAMMFAVVQFHHANIGLPDWLDRTLRVVIVTPAMHKVHHSREVVETNSNYTSFLSIWDRLFGTFRIRADAREIRFGLNEFDAQQDQSVAGMMRTPLKQIGTTSKSHLLYIGVILTLVAIAGAFAAARRHESPTWEDIQRRIATEYPDVRMISTTELDAWLHDSSQSPPVLLDVREADEFAVSHLAGAIRVSPAASGDQLPSEISKSASIVVYCSVGYRSAGMAKRLQAAGFADVRNLDGSIFRWANEGRPLMQGDTAVTIVHPYDESWGVLLNANRHPTSAP